MTVAMTRPGRRLHAHAGNLYLVDVGLSGARDYFKARTCRYVKDQQEDFAMTVVGIRYMIDDVPAAIEFYTTHLGFTVETDSSPAFFGHA